MKKVIEVNQKVRKDMQKVFKVTSQAIWLALTYDPKRGMSDKAKRIRQYAKLNGGYEAVVAERNDTLIFDSEGSFRQYFMNGAVLEFEKATGDASIYFDGEKVVHVENIRVSEMEEFQRTAEKWKKEECKTA